MGIEAQYRLVRDLPIPGSGCGDIEIRSDGCDLSVEYTYHSKEDGCDVVGSIIFSGVAAFRFRDEMHSAGFLQGSYDSLVEIVGSDWRQELSIIEPGGIWGSVENKKHFAVFFSSNGYLEVIADDFEELRPRKEL